MYLLERQIKGKLSCRVLLGSSEFRGCMNEMQGSPANLGDVQCVGVCISLGCAVLLIQLLGIQASLLENWGNTHQFTSEEGDPGGGSGGEAKSGARSGRSKVQAE